MAYRNTAADAGRKGTNARAQTKGDCGFQYEMPQPKGRWLPGYTGGMGRTSFQVDPETGSAGDEVGNDYDGDYDSNAPSPQN